MVSKQQCSSSSGGVETNDKSDEQAVLKSAYELSWEPDVAKHIIEEVTKRNNYANNSSSSRCDCRRPFMVSLVGIPGSGKSVSAMLLAEQIEQQQSTWQVMIMPHDGYHLPLQELQKFPDASDAVYRRGAPDTFDPVQLTADLRNIRSGPDPMVELPAFDHAVGDPEPKQFTFDRSVHDIVICEGLYLLHTDDGWNEIPELFDVSIFIRSNVDVCIERLKVRNLCVPGYNPEEINIRCDAVDRMNAHIVLKGASRATVVVDSCALAAIETTSTAPKNVDGTFKCLVPPPQIPESVPFVQHQRLDSAPAAIRSYSK